MAINLPVQHVGEVARPAKSARGLYSVATLLSTSRPVLYGVTVTMPNSGGHGLWRHTCDDAVDNPTKAGGEGDSSRVFPGVGVWAAEQCAAVGLGEEEAIAAAKAKLDAVESVDVERFLSDVWLDEAKTVSTVAAAESALLADGFDAVVHVPVERVAAMLDSHELVLTSGSLRTPLGSRVSIGAGYDDVYVTGAVTVYRADVDVYSTFDTSTNERLVVAERGVAIVWLGDVYKVDSDQLDTN